jgi:hypothetical protein
VLSFSTITTRPTGAVAFDERLHVLMTLDESTYEGGEMGADHPIAWYHDYEGGRAWYTALGHTVETWSEPVFLAHLLGGLEYAMGTTAAPKILTLAVSVQGRRATVTVRYAGCPGCSGTLQVGSTQTPLLANGSLATGTTPPLGRGHQRVFVILADASSGVRLKTSRPVVVH